MWQKEGLEMPNSIAEASREYRREMDVVEAFVEDCCTLDPNGKARAGELFKKYKNWARDNEEYLMSKQKFGQKMREKFEYKKNRYGRYYSGVVIRDVFPGMNKWK